MILSPYGRGVGVVAAVVSQPLTQTFSRHTAEESGSRGDVESPLSLGAFSLDARRHLSGVVRIQTKTKRQTDKETDRQRQTKRQTERERKRETEREKERDRERERKREKETERER